MSHIHLFPNISEYSFKIDKNSKIPIRLPPTNSPDGSYYEQPIPDYDAEFPAVAARRSSNIDMEFLDEEKEVYPLPNVRRRRQNDDEARLLSQSAFNRITETLGALNAVGKFFLNMTREVNGDNQHRDDMQLISSSSSSANAETTKQPSIEMTSVFSDDLTTTTLKSVPKDFPKISKNNTKTIEPLIKRVGLSQPASKGSKSDEQSLNEKIDMAALAEKKRKKHQAISPKKEIIAQATVSTTIAPGRFSRFEIIKWNIYFKCDFLLFACSSNR